MGRRPEGLETARLPCRRARAHTSRVGRRAARPALPNRLPARLTGARSNSRLDERAAETDAARCRGERPAGEPIQPAPGGTGLLEACLLHEVRHPPTETPTSRLNVLSGSSPVSSCSHDRTAPFIDPIRCPHRLAQTNVITRVGP